MSKSIKDIFNNFVELGYMRIHDMIIDSTDIHNKLVNFFYQTLKTQEMCFFPYNYNNEFDFVGKKEFDDNILNLLWCRLEEKPSKNKKIRLSCLLVWKSTQAKISSLINYNNNLGTISFLSNKDKYYEENYKTDNIFKTVYDIITKKITFYRNNMSFDKIQISNFRFNDSFNQMQISLEDYELLLESGYMISETNYFEENNKKIHYKYSQINSLLFLYIPNRLVNTYIDWMVIYVKKYIYEENIFLKIFPMNYNNIIVNDFYHNSLSNLFIIIKDNLEKITKSTEFLNSVKLQKKNINSKKHNSIYKILPDNFFHIHCTNLTNSINNNTDYILLTAHAKYEIINLPFESLTDIDYNYIDRLDNQYQITRFSYQNKDSILDRIYHNFYIFFNLKTNSHQIYYIKNIVPEINKLWSHPESIGIEESIGGNTYMEINFIENYSIIISKCNKKCLLFCNCK